MRRLPRYGRRGAETAFWLFLGLIAAGHLAAIFLQTVNWDELALLDRAVQTLRTGDIRGGGRPGLGTLLLLPFAAGCRNAIDALVSARLLWMAMVLGSAAGLWLLLRSVIPPSRYRWVAVATGVGLWVLAPASLEHSVQVRTDQPALLFGLWGSVALVASRQRPALAAVAGTLLATGFLASQKLLYIGALGGVLAGAELLIVRQWSWRRETVRALALVVGFGAVLLAFRLLTASGAGGPALLPVARGLATFQYYREHVGWIFYNRLLPGLFPQIMALLGLLALTGSWAQRRGRHGRELVAAWAVLALGVAVLLFHAGRFPYFYMVLGLFPATVGALTLPPLLERLPDFRARAVWVGGVIWLPLAVLAVAQTVSSLDDEQSYQRETLQFIDRNFPPNTAGFASRGELACRADTEPFPVRFSEHMAGLRGARGDSVAARLIREFRQRPVAFMVRPRDIYPSSLQQFWSRHYLRYWGPVEVAGQRIHGGAGWEGRFEVVVPGTYVWRSDDGTSRLAIGDRTLQPGERVRLSSAGAYSLALPQGGSGMLVLDLQTPPDPDPRPFFRPL